MPCNGTCSSDGFWLCLLSIITARAYSMNIQKRAIDGRAAGRRCFATATQAPVVWVSVARTEQIGKTHAAWVLLFTLFVDEKQDYFLSVFETEREHFSFLIERIKAAALPTD
ncbi:hypothetical protein B0T26DRAFT_177211 [Lasiosphaeria miniovina]|uniref:Uncharacterized protein n=1 Tax=Lasiosphaeria miniovina TaxID=1954250 RepID=A0AA40B6I2_9PEZI|nr:uncharacterized protein B0T26DRAFT_177211 [Lasiosphaeria miniovina]KAK0728563.1 hypothetical protein B0T26DRAFT_177211 [Lasiosphaeria miniovina]